MNKLTRIFKQNSVINEMSVLKQCIISKFIAFPSSIFFVVPIEMRKSDAEISKGFLGFQSNKQDMYKSSENFGTT